MALHHKTTCFSAKLLQNRLLLRGQTEKMIEVHSQVVINHSFGFKMWFIHHQRTNPLAACALSSTCTERSFSPPQPIHLPTILLCLHSLHWREAVATATKTLNCLSNVADNCRVNIIWKAENMHVTEIYPLFLFYCFVSWGRGLGPFGIWAISTFNSTLMRNSFGN